MLRCSVIAALLAAAVLVAGCGAAQPKSEAPPASQLSADLSGSPAPLAALHAQANQLLGGGLRAFRGRLASLRGHPVVVNNWASWCGPCQSEFPVFQKVSASLGRRVAFVGIDGKDASASATSFLRRFPVAYPSYVDPDGTIASAVLITALYPETAFFDLRGRRVFVHPGPYLSVAELLRDIRLYVLR